MYREAVDRCTRGATNVTEADETQVGAAIGMTQTIRGDDDFLSGGAYDRARRSARRRLCCIHAKFLPVHPEASVYSV